MNNLPINSKSQLPSNAANASQANAADDSKATDVQPAGPFASLLAQQIGGTAPSAPDTAQTATASGGNAADGNMDRTKKDMQDSPAVATVMPGDPANALSAILKQFANPESRPQKAGGMEAMQPVALGHFQGIENRQAVQPFAPDSSQTSRALPLSEGSQIAQFQDVNHRPSEATGRMELLSGLNQPAPKTAQAIASLAVPAAMLAVAADSRPAGNQPTIVTPLGNGGWADEFSQKISWMSTQQNHVAELHLNPPDLGPLDVVLKVSDDQATALFASPHGAVRDAVENALPKLREMLADNGIMLGNATISDRPPRDRQMDGSTSHDSGVAPRREVPGIAAEPAESALASVQGRPTRRHNGMVDTFA